jgi:putative oxidoreductase
MRQLGEVPGADTGPSDIVLISEREEGSVLKDLGVLILRLALGGFSAGHGSQKLLGWFGGYGLKGTAGWVESLGLKPGSWWAIGASLSEFGGGMLTALGLFHPLGPLGTMASMSMATAKVHWGKPIWVTEGGAELPVTNLATGLALVLTGPGRYSLDQVFGLRLPRALVILVAIAEVALLVLGIRSRPAPPAPSVEDQAGAKLEAGQEAGNR